MIWNLNLKREKINRRNEFGVCAHRDIVRLGYVCVFRIMDRRAQN